jgi:FkbM family methyltransferase
LGSRFSVNLPLSFRAGNREAEHLKLHKNTISSIETSGFKGKLKHYDFTFEDKKYCVDCNGLKHYLHRKQYFLNRGSVSVQPELGDYVIDGGACLGDTACVFSNAVGERGMVFSFDPVQQHLDVLEHNISQFSINNVWKMPFCLGNEDIDAEPIRLSGYAPAFKVDDSTVPMRKIDSLVKSGDIKRVDFIKLDVEGFEMQVLLGATQTINKFKPKLALSLYHKPDDMFELIAYIKLHHPFYQYYIGHYTIYLEETVLYCDPIVKA